MDQSKSCFPTKGKRCFPKKEKYIPKREMCQVNQSHEGEVAKKRENQRGNHGFRGRPSHHWMMVNIQASVSGFNWFQLVSSG